MHSLVDASLAKSDGRWNFTQAIPHPAIDVESANSTLAQSHDDESLFLGIFAPSICLHLPLVGFIGARLPEAPPQPRALPSPSTARLIEDVKLAQSLSQP
jgi:hypothetical protein